MTTAPDPGSGEFFHVVSRWRIEAQRDEVFAITGDPLRLPDWWGAVFMRVELVGEERRTVEGCTVRLYTKGLLPHTFQFLAKVLTADNERLMTIETQGDFRGRASIEQTDLGEEQLVTIDWRVYVTQPYIKPFLWMLKPVFVANHKWAMRKGRQGLQREVWRARGLEAGPPQVPTFPHNLALRRFQMPFSRVPRRWGDRPFGGRGGG